MTGLEVARGMLKSISRGKEGVAERKYYKLTHIVTDMDSKLTKGDFC